jgi:hypothetical protein
MTASGSEELGGKILAFFEEAARNPSIVEEYRAGGPDYLREQWGFTDEDIQALFGKPLTWAMTVLPQPPIVYPPPTPPTVL